MAFPDRSFDVSAARSEPPPDMNDDGPSDGAREMRKYFFRLLLVIAIGAVLMIGVALWAFYKYAGHIDDTPRRAPLPPPSANR
jgi:hypothetical protein